MASRFLLTPLVAALTALVLLGGCRRGDEHTPDGRLVIEYWEKWTGFEKQAMQEIVDDYNTSQDKVFVRFVSTSEIDRKLLLATAGGHPPDIAGFWSAQVTDYVEKGALLPLDSLLERDGISGGQYIDSIFRACSVHGHVWGLPSTPATIAIHYNAGHLREAGFDGPPADLEEFNRLAFAISRKNGEGRYERVGFLPNDPGWWDAMWPLLFGLPLVSEDRSTILCDSEEFIEVMDWYQRFIDGQDRPAIRAFEAAHRGEFASSSNSFMSGRIAMKLQGVWMANFIEQFAPDLDWGVFPFPSREKDAPPATIVECDLLVIPVGARHVEEAWDFIKFVQRRETMEKLCLLQRKFTPLRDVSPGFYAGHPNPHIRVFRELAESPNARIVPQISVWTEYRDELVVALDNVWVEGAEPRAQMLAVKARMQPRLDRANERWETVRESRLAQWSAQ